MTKKLIAIILIAAGLAIAQGCVHQPMDPADARDANRMHDWPPA